MPAVLASSAWGGYVSAFLGVVPHAATLHAGMVSNIHQSKRGIDTVGLEANWTTVAGVIQCAVGMLGCP